MQATVSYNQWIADLDHAAIGLTKKFGSLGTIGIGIVSLGVSGIEADRDLVPSFIEDFTPFDTNTGNYDYQDLGNDIDFFDRQSAPLPLIFSIGSAIDLIEENDMGTKLTLMADATKPQDSDQLVFTAGELQVMHRLKLRWGLSPSAPP